MYRHTFNLKPIFKVVHHYLKPWARRFALNTGCCQPAPPYQEGPEGCHTRARANHNQRRRQVSRRAEGDRPLHVQRHLHVAAQVEFESKVSKRSIMIYFQYAWFQAFQCGSDRVNLHCTALSPTDPEPMAPSSQLVATPSRFE